jgi:hypothetical protein
MVPQFRFSPPSRPPLRIGILLDGPVLSAFFARIIEDIQASNFAKIELLVYRKTTPDPKPANPPKTAAGKLANRVLDPKLRKKALYDLYLRMEKRRKSANHPLDSVDCSTRFTGIDTLEVAPIGKKFIQRFPAEALEKVQAKNLDVLLRFGFNILHGEILQAARYGVWSYHHGDNDYYRGGPPHFWEIYERSPLSGVILQVLTEELDGGMVLCKSLFTTAGSFSVTQNRFAPYWGSTDMVIRKLNELYRFGWDYLRERTVPTAPYQGKRKIYRTPGNSDMARWMGPLLLKKAVQSPFRKNSVQHWRIGIRMNGKRLFETNSQPDTGGFRWIEAPKGHFWADPFAVEHKARNWIFFEDYSYEKKRAGIACAEIASDGSLISPELCLENPNQHYSYPHTFWVGNDLFMIPEACSSGVVDLYRCQEFPHKWKRETTLLEGRFVDTTVWQQDGLWWMTTTSADPESRAGCLLLFYSDSLTGKWQFHPANPISTDIRYNRGAGGIFQSNTHFIRPSQSGCPIYGYSFTLNEITELSKDRYEERPLQTFTPSFWKGLDGVHTYNWVGNIELIDGQTNTPLREVSLSSAQEK